MRAKVFRKEIKKEFTKTKNNDLMRHITVEDFVESIPELRNGNTGFKVFCLNILKTPGKESPEYWRGKLYEYKNRKIV